MCDVYVFHTLENRSPWRKCTAYSIECSAYSIARDKIFDSVRGTLFANVKFCPCPGCVVFAVCSPVFFIFIFIFQKKCGLVSSVIVAAVVAVAGAVGCLAFPDNIYHVRSIP